MSYRFGFNGQEKVDEISGNGNHNTALFWEYDTRLGRRWNLDPKPQIKVSDYAVMNNNPICNFDLFGDKWKNESDKEKASALKKQFQDFEKTYEEKRQKACDNSSRADEQGNKKASDKYADQAEEAMKGRDEMKAAQSEIDKMGDDQKITFTYNDMGKTPPEGGQSNITWSGAGWGNDDPKKERLITINYFSRTANGYRTDGLKVHETKHGFQVLNGNATPVISLTKEKFSFSSLFQNEKEAYDRQFFFDRNSMPSSVRSSRDINREYLKKEGYQIDDK